MNATCCYSFDEARQFEKGVPSALTHSVLVVSSLLRTLSGALVLLVLGCLCCSAGEIQNKAARIDELVTRYQQCGYLNGAVLVAEHGQVIYAKGVGLANMELGTPNTPQTKFGIASITKQFTAALVLLQASKGNLRLDGTVSEYLPWYRVDTGKRMTLEQLLHHTSGLPADYDSPDFSDSPEALFHYERQAFAEKSCQLDLATEPGTKWAYSNRGYVLLGLILERVSGKSFGDLLQKELLVPLGLHNTGMDNNDLIGQGGASGYTRHAGPRYTPGHPLDRGRIFSAGAMYSTVEDLFRWNQALSSSPLFTADMREQIFRPGLGDWGYGWFISKLPPGSPSAGSTLAEMRGDLPGNYFSWILRYPDQDGVIIVLRNGYGSTERLEQNLQAVLFGQAPRLPRKSPKDILAHSLFVTYKAVAAHWELSLSAVLLSIFGLWHITNRATPRPLPA